MKRKYQPNRLFIPNNPLSPRISPELALEIGLNESIIFLQMEFWLVTEGQEHEGHLWVRKPEREIQRTFPFWGVATVHRIIELLVKKGFVIKNEKLDDGPGKGAGWFRFNEDGLATLKSVKVCSILEQGTKQPACSKMEHDPLQNGAPIHQDGATVLIEEESIKEIKEREGEAPPLNTKPQRPKPYPNKREWPRYVALYFSITNFAPAREVWPLIEEKLAGNPDPKRLRECFIAWRAHDYRPGNIGWLDWYETGIPERNGQQRQNGTNRQLTNDQKAARDSFVFKPKGVIE